MIEEEYDKYHNLNRQREAFLVAEDSPFRLHKFKDLYRMNKATKKGKPVEPEPIERNSTVAPVHDEHYTVHIPGITGFMKFFQ